MCVCVCLFMCVFVCATVAERLKVQLSSCDGSQKGDDYKADNMFTNTAMAAASTCHSSVFVCFNPYVLLAFFSPNYSLFSVLMLTSLLYTH